MIAQTLGRSFDWTGRATRKEAWAFLFFSAGLLVTLFFVEVWISDDHLMLPRLVWVVAAALVPAQISLMIRRAHDIGHSGRWLLLCLLPFVGLAVQIWLLLIPSGRSYRGSDHPQIALIGGLVVTIVLTFLTASRAFWQPYSIPAGSMKPTLLVGDRVIAWRPVGYRPERGDVVVFRHPRQPIDYVKRVIGLPGDTVQMKDGAVWLNGSPLPQADAGQFAEVMAPQGPAQTTLLCSNAPVGYGALCYNEQKIETMPDGKSHAILNTGTTWLDNSQLLTVPPGFYFVMGDNRDFSMDSRAVAEAGGIGMIPAENIIGRVRRVAYSVSGRHGFYLWTLRPDRIFMRIE